MWKRPDKWWHSWVKEQFELRNGHGPILKARYMGVNRHLFNFYLDAKYGEVIWTKWDGYMLKQLEMLQCVYLELPLQPVMLLRKDPIS